MRKALWGYGAAVIILGLGFGGGCGGKHLSREDYQERVKDVSEKYDGELVKSNEKFAGAKARSCTDFIDALKERYSHWKPGEAGERFCAGKPGAKARRDFELHVRAIHNQGVAHIKQVRLAKLKESYLEEMRKAAPKKKASSEDELDAEAMGAAGKEGGPFKEEVDPADAAFDLSDKPAPRRVAPAKRAGPVAVAPRTVSVPGLGAPGEQLPFAPDADEETPAPSVKTTLEQRQQQRVKTPPVSRRALVTSPGEEPPPGAKLEPVQIPEDNETPGEQIDKAYSEYE